MELMKCPIMSYREHIMEAQCMGIRCAWWNKRNECCAVLYHFIEDGKGG